MTVPVIRKQNLDHVDIFLLTTSTFANRKICILFLHVIVIVAYSSNKDSLCQAAESETSELVHSIIFKLLNIRRLGLFEFQTNNDLIVRFRG